MSDDIEFVRREAEQDYVAAREEAASRMKNQMTFADAAMKALLLTNGGAMVALFTFIGNVVGKGGSSASFNVPSLWWAFALFVAGLTLGLICHLFAFISQEHFYYQSMEEAWRSQRVAARGVREPLQERERVAYQSGMNAFTIGLITAVLSMALFAIGCGFALNGVLLR